MNNLLNKLMTKVNQGVAACLKMSTTEWIIFGLAFLLIIFIVSSPLLTILLFLAGWFLSVGFRNGIKAAYTKWKS